MSSSARIREPQRNPSIESLYVAPGNFVRPDEQPAWEAFNASFWDSLAPAGPVEALLVSEIARAAWRIRRCNKVEAGLSDRLSNPALDPMEDTATSDTQKRVDRARGQAERSIDRLLSQLRRTQADRQFRNEPLREAQGPPDAAPNSGGTHPSSRDSAAITCACSKKDVSRPDHGPASFGQSEPLQKEPAPVPAAATETAQTPVTTPRNAPCPCGSGQKHKRCCGRNAPPVLTSVLGVAA